MNVGLYIYVHSFMSVRMGREGGEVCLCEGMEQFENLSLQMNDVHIPVQNFSSA